MKEEEAYQLQPREEEKVINEIFNNIRNMKMKNKLNEMANQ